MRKTNDTVTLNDTGLLDNILKDNVFMGILGVLECRSPTLTALTGD